MSTAPSMTALVSSSMKSGTPSACTAIRSSSTGVSSVVSDPASCALSVRSSRLSGIEVTPAWPVHGTWRSGPKCHDQQHAHVGQAATEGPAARAWSDLPNAQSSSSISIRPIAAQVSRPVGAVPQTSFPSAPVSLALGHRRIVEINAEKIAESRPCPVRPCRCPVEGARLRATFSRAASVSIEPCRGCQLPDDRVAAGCLRDSGNKSIEDAYNLHRATARQLGARRDFPIPGSPEIIITCRGPLSPAPSVASAGQVLRRGRPAASARGRRATPQIGCSTGPLSAPARPAPAPGCPSG